MTAEQNKALVLRFYAHFANLEFDQMFDLMADDGVWSVAGDPATFHHAGVLSKAERKAACHAFMDIIESMEMDILSSTAEGDRVVIEGRTRCTSRTGVVYAQEPLLLLRCRDGKIVSIYEHIDQQATLGFERALAASLAA